MAHDVLQEILNHKRREVEQARAARPLAALRAEPLFTAKRRDFFGEIARAAGGGKPALIAEFKRSSPSAGEIRPGADPVEIARLYESAGAAAFSILTDEKFFGARVGDLPRVRAATARPILRKDFIVDAYQIFEARAIGADAVLLIAEALRAEELAAFHALARRLEMDVLVEVHSLDSLREVRAALTDADWGGTLLGINNRDLKRQLTDLAIFETVAPHGPPGVPLVAESGLKTSADVVRMTRAGARALLVGESLLRQTDPAAAIRTLLS